MADLPYRTLRAEDALRDMTHHLTQATHHANKAHEAHRLYLSLLPGGEDRTLPGISPGRRRSAPKCVAAWTEFLQENGPALRQEVQDATGERFTERAYPYTIVWEDEMENYGDDEFMDDAIVRIRGVREGGGRGGAPVIFFLWSQRFDLYGKYGVGPKSRPEPETLLGVVHPPTAQPFHGTPEIQYEPLTGEPVPEPEVEPDPQVEVESSRFATLDEWRQKWDSFFDTLVKYGVVPTQEEKEEMLSTMPEDTGGESPGTILAMGLHEVRQRAESGEV